MARATAEQLILNWSWLVLWLAYHATPHTHARLESFFRWASWSMLAVALFRFCNVYLVPRVFALPARYEMAVYAAWPMMGILSAITLERLQRSAPGKVVAFLMGLVTFTLFVLLFCRLYSEDASLAALLCGSVLTLVVTRQALDQLSPEILPDDKGQGRLHSVLPSGVLNVIGTGRKDALLPYAVTITGTVILYMIHDGIRTDGVDTMFELCFGGSVGLLGLIAAFSTFTLEMTRDPGVSGVLMRGTKVLAWLFFALAVSALTGLVLGDGTGPGAAAVTLQYERPFVANLAFVLTLLLTVSTLLMTVLAFRQITDSIQADKDVAARREKIKETRGPIIAIDTDNAWQFGEEKDYGPMENSARGASWLRDRWTRAGLVVEELVVASASADRVRARILASHKQRYEALDLESLLANVADGMNVLVVFEAVEARNVAPLLQPLGITPLAGGEWRLRAVPTRPLAPGTPVDLLPEGAAEPATVAANAQRFSPLQVAEPAEPVLRMSPLYYYDHTGMDLLDNRGVALGAAVGWGRGMFMVLGVANLFTNQHASHLPEALLHWVETHLLAPPLDPPEPAHADGHVSGPAEAMPMEVTPVAGEPAAARDAVPVQATGAATIDGALQAQPVPEPAPSVAVVQARDNAEPEPGGAGLAVATVQPDGPSAAEGDLSVAPPPRVIGPLPDGLVSPVRPPDADAGPRSGA